MKTQRSIPSLMVFLLSVFSVLFCGCALPKLNKNNGEPPPGNIAGAYDLDEKNTSSVTVNERGRRVNFNDWVWKAGEWTADRQETQYTLVKLNLPEIRDFEKGTLHLVIQEYGTADRPCDFKKQFVLKKITQDWDPASQDFATFRQVRESAEVVSSFGIVQEDKEINIEIPVKEILEAKGLLIDQAEESYCLVSFYSQDDKNEKNKRPSIKVGED